MVTNTLRTKAFFLLCAILAGVASAERRRKSIDIHARAAWKVSDECPHGCIGGDKENPRCGTEEECTDFLTKVANADMLMYGVLATVTAIVLFICCVWSD